MNRFTPAQTQCHSSVRLKFHHYVNPLIQFDYFTQDEEESASLVSDSDDDDDDNSEPISGTKWKRCTDRMRKALWQKACALHQHWPRSDSGIFYWTKPEPRSPHVTPAVCQGCSMLPREVGLMEMAILERCVELGISPTAVATDPDSRRRVSKDLLLDLSQGVSRRPWKVGRIGRLTTNSRWYSFCQDRVLQPEELWANYGRCGRRRSRDPLEFPLSAASVWELHGSAASGRHCARNGL